jgi:hypothetical protein
MNVTLRRIVERDDATLGVLLFDGVPRLVTLELPWRENKRNMSRIPPGSYEMGITISPRFGKAWEVKDVPSRSNILFHQGNTAKDTEGCILVATKYGVTLGDSRISESIDGLGWLHTFLSGVQTAQLEVIDDFRA